MRWIRSLAAGVAIPVVGLVLAACGGGTRTGSTAARINLTLAKLGGLHDYAWTESAGSGASALTVSGQVHSSTDWEFTTGSPAVHIFDVLGQGYTETDGVTAQIDLAASHEAFADIGEQAFATFFLTLESTPGVSVSRTGSCTVAGEAGTVIQATDGSALRERVQVCVASASGALLSFSSATSGPATAGLGSTPGGATFKVTGVGSVPLIGAPGAAPATGTNSAPPPASSRQGLPAGFPASVPAPPGQITRATATGSSLWDVEVTGTSASLLTAYEQSLQQAGFQTSTDVSAGSAGTIVMLSNGKIQVQLTGAASGQGYAMTILVTLGA